MNPRRDVKPGGGVANPVQFSANYKIAEVAKRMGVQDLSKMQITTRQIYHALKIAPVAVPNQTMTFNFFQTVNTVNFPLTNLNENKLQAGEAIAVERAYLSILTTAPGNPLNLLEVQPIEFYPSFAPFLRSDLDLNIDRQTVTKKVNTTSFYAPFNKSANWGGQLFDGVQYKNYGQSIYHFDNSFVIIPQIEFSVTLTTPSITTTPNPALDYYVMLNLEGLGCLFNPKANY